MQWVTLTPPVGIGLTIGDAVIKPGDEEFENVQKGVCEKLNLERGEF